MKFQSIDDAFEFYNQYAREAGFSARYSNSRKNKMTNEVVWKQFVCFKAGQTDEARSKNRAPTGGPIQIRARGEVRTNCKAKISIVKQQAGSDWSVSVFIVLTQQFSEANIPTYQQMQLLEMESGGPESVGCTERDIRNLERELRDEQKGIDAETLIEFFTSEKEKNSSFFFDYETDSDHIFKRCFWADPKSRRAYGAFGDVVVFDSTYNTNNDEKTESYIWLLNKFMEAMPSDAPKAIITDQDPAMTKALAQVLPETVHRYCLWHILNKFPEKISPVIFRDHYQRIRNVIKNSTSPEEFENGWKEVIRCANLEQNSWILLMYGMRHKHMLAFFRVNQIFELPDKYILKRWTREAKIGVAYILDDENCNDDPTRFLISRRAKLSYKASTLIDYASLTDEGTKFLDEQLDYIHGKIKEMGISPTTMHRSQTRKSLDKTKTIGDPSKIRSKGCGKRMLSSKEKSILKTRACHGCGLRGASHDKRNCPKLQDRSVAYDHYDISQYANERA
ncbi:hypothetical protein SASPL_148593 [Salvia splendens]|uniref:Protein FAR1-RELATED SEQUENCE n=1 Tax=Salvia splendens TaxID=180675 RepID=A0A8X8W9L9_SALSN|nr:hypothetical protein SASPL_148593 [Salvia splendens]